MAKGTFIFPHYEVSGDGHSIRRYDNAEGDGVIVAFCPDPAEAHTLANAVMRDIEHGALISVLNGTHEALRQLSVKLEGT